jgi:hypothetical protein
MPRRAEAGLTLVVRRDPSGGRAHVGAALERRPPLRGELCLGLAQLTEVELRHSTKGYCADMHRSTQWSTQSTLKVLSAVSYVVLLSRISRAVQR